MMIPLVARRSGLLWALLLGMSASSQAYAQEVKQISGNHEGNCFNPTISPDGLKIAYEVNSFEKRSIDLYMVGITDKKVEQVRPLKAGANVNVGSFGVSSGGDQVNYELAWSPAKLKRYVFASSGTDKNYELYLSSGGVISPHSAADGQPVWSDDGTYIVFTSARTGEGDLYLLNVNDPSKVTQLTSYKDGPEWYPTFAPGSNKLAFVRHSASDGDNLYIMNDVTNPKSLVQITKWSSIQTKASWSPDGTRLAFYSNKEAKDRYDLYVVEAKAGATPLRLMTGVVPNERRGPAWSPDGKSVLQVVDRAEQFNPILVVNVADPTQTKVLNTDTQNNGDVSLRKVGDKTWITFTAQGKETDTTKAFKRVYLFEVPAASLTFP